MTDKPGRELIPYIDQFQTIEEKRQHEFGLICDDIINGMSLRQALTVNGNMSFGMFYKTVETSSSNREQYARSIRWRNETRFEELIDIADNKDGDPKRDRLRWDARRWNLSKSQPKKYGDRLDGLLEEGTTVRSIQVTFAAMPKQEEDDDGD